MSDEKSVMRIAFRDISKHIQSNYTDAERFTKFWRGMDSWICSPEHLYTKETIRLNRQLGIHKINKQNGK